MPMTDEKADISGMGGWLAILLVTIVVIMPIGPIVAIALFFLDNVADLPSPALPEWMSLGVVSTTLEFLQVALCWIIGWRLFSDRRWRTVRWTIVGVLIMAPGLVTLRMLALGVYFGTDRSTLFEMFASEFGRSCLYCFIWITYLLRSRRVANTYPRYGDEERLAAVFD